MIPQFMMDTLNIYMMCNFNITWSVRYANTLNLFHIPNHFRQIRKQHARSHSCLCFKQAANQQTNQPKIIIKMPKWILIKKT